MTPTVARHRESRTFFEPDGNLILVLPVSWSWEMMTAGLPEALASLPRSPTFISIAQQAVPSGIFPIGSTLPMWGSLVTAVDRLSSGCTFSSNEGLGVLAVFVWVLEGNTDEWSTSAWIVDDVLYDTLDKAMSFSKVHCSVLGGALAGTGDGLEDTASTFTTGSDDTSHL